MFVFEFIEVFYNRRRLLSSLGTGVPRSSSAVSSRTFGSLWLPNRNVPTKAGQDNPSR